MSQANRQCGFPDGNLLHEWSAVAALDNRSSALSSPGSPSSNQTQLTSRPDLEVVRILEEQCPPHASPG
jgi:hypothetical protein